MNGLTKRNVLLGLALGLCIVAACTVTPGPAISFTIGNKTFTLDLGLLFNVQPGSSVNQWLDAEPFEQTPTDTPSSGSITLRGSSVTVNDPPPLKGTVSAQTVSGTATLTIMIDEAGAPAPCDTGIEIGSLEITFAGGVVTSGDLDLELSAEALALVITNNFSLCFQMQSDVAVQIVVGGIDFVFGPPVDVPGGNENDNVTGSSGGNENVNGSVGGNGNANDSGGCTVSSDCAAGQTCDNGVCAETPAGCTGDADCGAGETCNAGTCVPDAAGCVSDADCGNGETCDAGTCVPDIAGCASDTDCSSGEVCDNGTCITVPVGCTLDSECEFVESCIEGACVTNFTLADVMHTGSEQIIVGPLADEASGYGFVPDSGFGVTHMTLSGNGQNLWFITYNEFFEVATDQQRLYIIHIDGTSLLRSAVPLDSITDGFAVPIIRNLATGDDGLRAVIEARRNLLAPVSETASVFFDILEPGLSATFLYDTLGQAADSPSSAGIRLSDDGNFVSWSDGTDLWRHPMNILNTVPDLEFTAADFPCGGTPAREINGWDRTTVDEKTLFQPSAFDIAADAWCHGLVLGSSQTDSADQDLTQHDYSISSVNITDDGLTMGYCLGAGMSDPAPCFVQPVNGAPAGFALEPTSDTWSKFGGLILADRSDRYRAVVTENTFAPNGISFFETAGQNDRRTTGTDIFGGNNQSVSSNKLSDDGNVMAGLAGSLSQKANIYILHDGTTGLAGFPSIESIASRYDAESDALILRVQVASDNGVNLVQAYPLKNGIDPGEYVLGEENPFFGIRFGFGGTTTPIEGTTDIYEQSIPLFGLGGLIDDSYVLRITAVDGTGSRTVFADIQAPLP